MDTLETIGAILILAGGIVTVIGALGLVRLKDVYARIHAAGVVDTGGVALMILGMVFLAPSFIVAVKLVFVGIFLFFTCPISSHAIAQAAFRGGIRPRGSIETKTKSRTKTKKRRARR